MFYYICWFADWNMPRPTYQVEVIPETVGQYTEQNDSDKNEIYEGMRIHQLSVLTGAKDIDFIGVVKFYDGTWWVDSGTDAVELFNETCENTIIRE